MKFHLNNYKILNNLLMINKNHASSFGLLMSTFFVVHLLSLLLMVALALSLVSSMLAVHM